MIVFVSHYIALRPYNARNGIEDEMLDPKRIVCVTDQNDIVVEVPHQ